MLKIRKNSKIIKLEKNSREFSESHKSQGFSGSQKVTEISGKKGNPNMNQIIIQVTVLLASSTHLKSHYQTNEDSSHE